MSDEEDLLDSIPDEIGEPWIAEEAGDQTAGTIIDLYEVKDEFSDTDKVPVVVIKTPEGEIQNIAGYRSGLRQEIRKHDLIIGGKFAVRYMGEVEVKKGKFRTAVTGKPFHAYKSAYRPPKPVTVPEVEERGAETDTA